MATNLHDDAALSAERLGYAAVGLFFAISGFIVTHVTAGAPFRPEQWANDRFIRIRRPADAGHNDEVGLKPMRFQLQ